MPNPRLLVPFLKLPLAISRVRNDYLINLSFLLLLLLLLLLLPLLLLLLLLLLSLPRTLASASSESTQFYRVKAQGGLDATARTLQRFFWSGCNKSTRRFHIVA